MQVAEGPKLPPTAYRVAIVLVSCLNSRTGEAFPSEETLADRLGLDRGANEDDLKKRARKRADATKTVRRGRDALVAAGHWTFKWKDGHLCYSPVFHEAELSQAWGSIASPARQDSLRREAELPPEPKKEPKKEPWARTSRASPGGSRRALSKPRKKDSRQGDGERRDVGAQHSGIDEKRFTSGRHRDPADFGLPLDCRWVGDRGRWLIFRNSEGDWCVPQYGGGDVELVVDVRPQKEMAGLATGGGDTSSGFRVNPPQEPPTLAEAGNRQEAVEC